MKVAFRKQNDGNGLIKSVMTAHLILLLHVLLLAGIAVLVLIFRGLVQHMVWIALGGTALISLSAWWFYRRMRAEGKNLGEVLNSSRFRDQTVEVSLLGGLASFRIGAPHETRLLDAGASRSAPQLEDPETVRIRELTELVKLLQNGFITRDEYEKAKHQIFRN